MQRDFLEHTSDQRLETHYEFEKKAAEELMAKRASRISLISQAPDAFAGIDPKRLQMYQTTYSKVKQPVTKATMNNDISWLVVAAASPEWAKIVFPDLETDDALTKLWQAIFTICRVDQPDPVAAWKNHINFLTERAEWLNNYQFDALHYHSPKTDLFVGLPKDHHWEGAGSHDGSGNFFVPNIPTEEVFTAPDFKRIDGTVSSTLPLSYNGQIIEGLTLTFKNGQITNATADEGEELLNHLIQTDNGSKSLGEVALVPEDSPIATAKTIFYNTLFDENASDHLAIGAGYPFSIKNGTSMSRADLQKAGLNDSTVHVDFMVGSSDMNINGITKDGEAIPIMKNGIWA